MPLAELVDRLRGKTTTPIALEEKPKFIPREIQPARGKRRQRLLDECDEILAGSLEKENFDLLVDHIIGLVGGIQSHEEITESNLISYKDQTVSAIKFRKDSFNHGKLFIMPSWTQQLSKEEKEKVLDSDAKPKMVSSYIFYDRGQGDIPMVYHEIYFPDDYRRPEFEASILSPNTESMAERQLLSNQKSGYLAHGNRVLHFSQEVEVDELRSFCGNLLSSIKDQTALNQYGPDLEEASEEFKRAYEQAKWGFYTAEAIRGSLPPNSNDSKSPEQT